MTSNLIHKADAVKAVADLLTTIATNRRDHADDDLAVEVDCIAEQLNAALAAIPTISGEGQIDEQLEAWARNVALECSGHDEPYDFAIGGAVLNLHDLDRILQAALLALQSSR